MIRVREVILKMVRRDLIREGICDDKRTVAESYFLASKR